MMNEDSLDIYCDLLTDEQTDKAESNAELTKLLCDAKSSVKGLQNELDAKKKSEEALSQQNEDLKRKISALLLTARSELGRKNAIIEDLREQVDDYTKQSFYNGRFKNRGNNQFRHQSPHIAQLPDYSSPKQDTRSCFNSSQGDRCQTRYDSPLSDRQQIISNSPHQDIQQKYNQDSPEKCTDRKRKISDELEKADTKRSRLGDSTIGLKPTDMQQKLHLSKTKNISQDDIEKSKQSRDPRKKNILDRLGNRKPVCENSESDSNTNEHIVKECKDPRKINILNRLSDEKVIKCKQSPPNQTSDSETNNNTKQLNSSGKVIDLREKLRSRKKSNLNTNQNPLNTVKDPRLKIPGDKETKSTSVELFPLNFKDTAKLASVKTTFSDIKDAGNTNSSLELSVSSADISTELNFKNISKISPPNLLSLKKNNLLIDPMKKPLGVSFGISTGSKISKGDNLVCSENKLLGEEDRTNREYIETSEDSDASGRKLVIDVSKTTKHSSRIDNSSLSDDITSQDDESMVKDSISQSKVVSDIATRNNSNDLQKIGSRISKSSKNESSALLSDGKPKTNVGCTDSVKVVKSWSNNSINENSCVIETVNSTVVIENQSKDFSLNTSTKSSESVLVRKIRKDTSQLKPKTSKSSRASPCLSTPMTSSFSEPLQDLGSNISNNEKYKIPKIENVTSSSNVSMSSLSQHGTEKENGKLNAAKNVTESSKKTVPNHNITSVSKSSCTSLKEGKSVIDKKDNKKSLSSKNFKTSVSKTSVTCNDSDNTKTTKKSKMAVLCPSSDSNSSKKLLDKNLRAKTVGDKVKSPTPKPILSIEKVDAKKSSSCATDVSKSGKQEDDGKLDEKKESKMHSTTTKSKSVYHASISNKNSRNTKLGNHRSLSRNIEKVQTRKSLVKAASKSSDETSSETDLELGKCTNTKTVDSSQTKINCATEKNDDDKGEQNSHGLDPENGDISAERKRKVEEAPVNIAVPIEIELPGTQKEQPNLYKTKVPNDISSVDGSHLQTNVANITSNDHSSADIQMDVDYGSDICTESKNTEDVIKITPDHTSAGNSATKPVPETPLSGGWLANLFSSGTENEFMKRLQKMEEDIQLLKMAASCGNSLSVTPDLNLSKNTSISTSCKNCAEFDVCITATNKCDSERQQKNIKITPTNSMNKDNTNQQMHEKMNRSTDYKEILDDYRPERESLETPDKISSPSVYHIKENLDKTPEKQSGCKKIVLVRRRLHDKLRSPEQNKPVENSISNSPVRDIVLSSERASVTRSNLSTSPTNFSSDYDTNDTLKICDSTEKTQEMLPILQTNCMDIDMVSNTDQIKSSLPNMKETSPIMNNPKLNSIKISDTAVSEIPVVSGIVSVISQNESEISVNVSKEIGQIKSESSLATSNKTVRSDQTISVHSTESSNSSVNDISDVSIYSANSSVSSENKEVQKSFTVNETIIDCEPNHSDSNNDTDTSDESYGNKNEKDENQSPVSNVVKMLQSDLDMSSDSNGSNTSGIVPVETCLSNISTPKTPIKDHPTSPLSRISPVPKLVPPDNVNCDSKLLALINLSTHNLLLSGHSISFESTNANSITQESIEKVENNSPSTVTSEKSLGPAFVRSSTPRGKPKTSFLEHQPEEFSEGEILDSDENHEGCGASVMDALETSMSNAKNCVESEQVVNDLRSSITHDVSKQVSATPLTRHTSPQAQVKIIKTVGSDIFKKPSIEDFQIFQGNQDNKSKEDTSNGLNSTEDASCSSKEDGEITQDSIITCDDNSEHLLDSNSVNFVFDAKIDEDDDLLGYLDDDSSKTSVSKPKPVTPKKSFVIPKRTRSSPRIRDKSIRDRLGDNENKRPAFGPRAESSRRNEKRRSLSPRSSRAGDSRRRLYNSRYDEPRSSAHGSSSSRRETSHGRSSGRSRETDRERSRHRRDRS
ncbi:uncharacterized protein LOC126811710 [Patella vulgata]|uniref:uncharacterized protein LOC126811710 n=1 Tax=Patella vulgata TaxID=6465 RepID=UPI00218008F0|nr:uncharacterized protein LOC126811710 [Patella vulgata]